MPGHLFVIHGRIESLVHDAAVVPTNGDFEIEPTWVPLLEPDPGSLRPDAWPGDGYGRARDDRPVWFVDVGGLSTADLATRTIATVRAMATADLPPSRNRVKRLLAVPVLGIEGGGHEHERGTVIHELMRGLLEAVRELDVDIAVVSPEPSVHGAAQHVRGRPRPDGFSEDLLAEAERVGEMARRGELALFFGAGVGVPAGLPAWNEMLHALAETAGVAPGSLDALSPLDQAQFLQQRLPRLGEEIVRGVSKGRRPSLAHALLAGLGCREAVTTNYDRLYEDAVAATSRGTPRRLPWDDAVGADSWVLKLHGDVSEPAGIILTRRDVVRFDAETGPSGALLQALLLTRHLLIVGASLNDDNVVRLLREVELFRHSIGIATPMATFLDVDADDVRRELWRDELAWSTMPGDTLPERARALEVFLDTVSWYAADTSSWLLDERFSGLLDERSRAAADEARRLRERLDGLDDTWTRLREALDRVGGAAS